MSWKTSPYFTHQPVLNYFAHRAHGPMLELGSGDGSTQMLHEIAQENKTTLLTMDNDPEWLSKYTHLQNEWHSFVQLEKGSDGPAWEKKLQEEKIHERKWSLVFIDQSPWDARVRSLRLLKHQADVVIIHDADYFPEHGLFGSVQRYIQPNQPGLYNFQDVFIKWKMYYPPTPWCAPTGPPTLVGTMLAEIDLPETIDDFKSY